MNNLRGIINRFKGKRVVVFGDLVADVFVYGEISRISREAPVLILNHRETQIVPGGGANAPADLRGRDGRSPRGQRSWCHGAVGTARPDGGSICHGGSQRFHGPHDDVA